MQLSSILLAVLCLVGEWWVGNCYPGESSAVTWSSGQADPLVKRGYIVHNVENGNPRYTTLVRRNFLRFGKRGDPNVPLRRYESQWPFTDKRTRNFIRFGKRSGAADYDQMEDNVHMEPRSDPDMMPQDKMRRVSNFLRFGKRDNEVDEDDIYQRCIDLQLPMEMCDQQQQQMGQLTNMPDKKMKQFLRFGR